MTTDEAIASLRKQQGLLAAPKLQSALTATRDDYTAQVNRSFAGACDPDGTPWDAINYRVVPPPPLEVTGALHDSVLADIMAATITDATLATDGGNLVDYAAEQQYGMEYDPPKRVKHMANLVTLFVGRITWFPARPFIGLGKDTIDKAVEHGVNEMNRLLLEAWA